MYASKMAPARPARPNNNQLLTRFKAKNLQLTRLKSLWLPYKQVSNKFLNLNSLLDTPFMPHDSFKSHLESEQVDVC